MRTSKLIVLVLLIACLAVTTAAQNTSRFDAKRLDLTCKPCEDFYRFVNGNWLKENPVPPAYSRWGTFQILQEDNIAVLRQILESAAKSNAAQGTNEQIVGSYYASCMDEPRIESL